MIGTGLVSLGWLILCWSPYQTRCGYGPRQPLLVISPFAKRNFVDHTVTDQSSVLRFIEDNWETGRIGNFSFDTKAGFALEPVLPRRR